MMVIFAKLQFSYHETLKTLYILEMGWNKNGNILNFSIRLNTRIPIAYWVSPLPINMKGRLLMWQCPDRSSCAYLLFLHFRRNTQKPKGIQVSSQRQFLFPSSSELPAFYLSFLVLVTPMKSVSNTRQGDRQGGWGWREEYMGERKKFQKRNCFLESTMCKKF